jgi:hypothetical protein
MERPVVRYELFPFSYFDTIRKRWVKARYKAELSVIKARYSQWRLDGEPEIREGALDPRVDPNGPHGV